MLRSRETTIRDYLVVLSQHLLTDLSSFRLLNRPLGDLMLHPVITQLLHSINAFPADIIKKLILFKDICPRHPFCPGVRLDVL